MKWEAIYQATIDPLWAIGMIQQARRVGEAAMPIGKRVATAFVAAIPAATLAAGGSLLGIYVGLQDTINDIRSEFRTKDIRIESMIAERTILREAQMRHFGEIQTNILARLGGTESAPARLRPYDRRDSGAVLAGR